VDHAGSRILFRGYGESEKTWPIHAALTANDSLILLDEAHCSKPFAETMSRIEKYRSNGWAKEEIESPFAFVEMTATPTRLDSEAFKLNDEDYSHAILHQRLFARKPARLVFSKARTKDHNRFAQDLVSEAKALAKEPGLKRIAVMVNRVRTARLVYDLLKQEQSEACLLIGRMRPIDRENLPGPIDAMCSGKDRQDGEGTVFVVATQCLEVGADLDFDGLVTECASIDALLQRFGRLDRVGELSVRGVTAQGRIVASSAMTDEKYNDRVYGDALSRTCIWLNSFPNLINFAICSDAGGVTVRERLQGKADAQQLRRESPAAPVLLPAHLDLFVQTSPRPAIDPDPHVFLHGKEDSRPEVQVIWRLDLNNAPVEDWAEIVALCPPVSAEAMPVPFFEFQRWIAGKSSDAGSDLEGAEGDEDEPRRKKNDDKIQVPVLRWRGDQSEFLSDAKDLRPGDTLILAEAAKGWDELGYVPDETDGAEKKIDAAERARSALQRGWTLRLFPDLIARWPETGARAAVESVAANPAADNQMIRDALDAYGKSLEGQDWLKTFLADLRGSFDAEGYPLRDGKHAGWVISTRYAEADSGQDESSSSEPVPLNRHLEHVAEWAVNFSEPLREDLRHAIQRAAEYHDCGKADERFQALLHGGDPIAARYAPQPLAKGRQSRPSPNVRRQQWKRSGLPDGFRHELVSLALVQVNSELASNDLVLHLIAAHHGCCRPFAPVVNDGIGVQWNDWRLAREQAENLAAHLIDSGVCDRFWSLTRRYGWWGLAHLETLLRLGDWKASKEEIKHEHNAVGRA